jgi:hypothetical protein
MRQGFVPCYKGLLDRRGPDAGGHGELLLHVDCDGRIASIDAQGAGIDRETLVCMCTTAGAQRFNAPDGGPGFLSVPFALARLL